MGLEVMPMVDGAPLSELVSRFEELQHFEPAGGYGGLIPEWFHYGPIGRYLMGQIESDSMWTRMDGVYVLGCQCGEVGCWPLVCRIEADGDSIRWHRFRQPHRPDRDYGGFGPFVFHAEQYREAVAAVAARLSV